MTELSDIIRNSVRKFFNSDAGEQLVAWMRENPPAEPFPNAEHPHQVQTNYGFLKGLDARLKQFSELAQTPERPEVEKTPKLHNTRTS